MAGETDGLQISVLARQLGELGAAGLAEQLRREGAELLAEAVARSEAALRRDPGQLAAHLAGRLGGQLPARVFAGHASAWLRPLSTSLEPPRSPLRATLQEHGAEVRAVLVMPDGQTLLSSAEDGRVLRWDLASEALLGELVGHESTVNAMALTPDGDLLLTASDDFTIGLWDTAQWQLVDQLRGHTHYVRLALAGAAGLVVSASNDGTIRVWDLAERRELRVITGHTSTITAMTLIDGGMRVAAASTKHLIAVWDLATGERAVTLFDGSAGYRGEILGLTLAADNDSGVGHKSFPSRMWQGPDGGLYSAEQELVGWDPASGKQVSRGGEHRWRIGDVAVSPALLATASDTVRLLAHDGTLRATLYGHEEHVTAVGFSPDGRTLVSGGSDNTLRVWDVEAALQRGTSARHSGWVEGVLRSPDGTRCVTYTSDGLAHLWELATGTHVRAFSHEQALLSAACFTPDGSRLVVTSSNGHLWVWDVARGERVAKGFARDYWFQHLVPLADGRRMISGASNRPMAIWDIERGEPELFAGPPVQVSALALTPDERFAVTSVFELDKPGSLQVWDVASRSRVAELKAEDKTSFGSLVLADAGRLAVTAGRGGQMVVVSLPDAAIVHALPAAKRWVSRLVRLADDRVLAGSTEADRAVLREVDVKRGVVLREVSVALADGGRGHEMRALAVAADGRRALIVADWSARLVDLESGRMIARFVGDAKIVSGVIRPDGAGALVGEEGGRVHVLALEGA